MPEKMNLAQKLVEVMKSVESVPKNGWNDHFKYHFAQEFDILQAVRGKLGELGVLVLTSIEGATKTADITEVMTQHTFLDADSGEKIEVKGYGQGKDGQDKGGPKAITSAVKYFLTKNLLIPTGDDPEKDDTPPQNGKPAARNGTPRKNGKKPVEPPPAPAPSRSPDKSTPAQQKEIRDLCDGLKIKIADLLAEQGMKSPISKEEAEKLINHLKASSNCQKQPEGSRR